MASVPSRISRYEILDRLGEGGMGVLYLARDPLLDRTVAIKVLSVYNPELHERFAREARSAAALKHQHIVTIYDVGEEGGRPFLAMEYIDGETLGELIRRRPALAVARKLQILQELCSGLSYAHRRGIVHRDIKPANVMITSEGSVKILDFGLARIMTEITNAGLTQAGALMGTPHYMAPEQVEGKRADERSDIFAVGLVMYELLSYRKAYSGDSPHVVLHRIVSVEPPRLGEVCEGIDPELEAVVHKAIEKSPDRRYQDLVTLGADVKAIFDRLTEGANDPTVRVDVKRERKGKAPGSDPHVPFTPPRNFPSLDSINQRRAAQIAQHLREGQRHFTEGRFEAAIEQCELAALLDPQDGRMLDLLHAAHRAMEDRKVMGWLDEAKEHLSAGAVSAAEALIQQSLELRPDSADAQQLKRAIEERRREQERARERARLARSAIERARTSLAEEAYEAALRAAGEALGYDRSNHEALALRDQANAALAERQRAFDTAADARQLAAEGAHQDALELLRAFTPRVAIIEEAEAEIAAELEVLERRREEERRRQAEEERRRIEEARRRREEQARQEEEKRQREAEAERKRQAEEEARRIEARRREEEDRLRQEEEKRQREAEDEHQRQAEEDARRIEARRRDEEQRLREENEKRQREENEKRLREEHEKRQREAEAERQRQAEEEARRLEARRREEVERLRQEEEKRAREAEAARQRHAEDERRRLEARRREEEEARRREEEKRRQREAERLRREAEEAERRAREDERAREEAVLQVPSAHPAADLAEFERVPETLISFPPPPAGLPPPVVPDLRRRTPVAAALVAVAVVAAGLGTWLYLRPAESPRPASQPQAAAPAPEPPPAPPVASQVGLSINAVPWARVRIAAADGKGEAIERTTPFSVSLPEGQYTLEFQHPAFGTVRKKLEVRPGLQPSITQVMPGADVDRIVSDVLGAR